MDEVIQQSPVAEDAARKPFVGNHGSLVHDVEGVLLQVGGGREPLFAKCLLSVDMPVYGAGRRIRIYAHHFCRPAGGSQQHHTLLQHLHRPYQSTYQRGLSRAGITFQQEHAIIAPAKQEPAPRVYYKILFLRGNMHEVSSYQCSEILTYHKTFRKKGRKVSLLEFFLLTLRCECTKI